MLHAPATERNREPILTVLRRVLPPSGLVLEIASGTGQHAVHFATALPSLQWQPSDPDPSQRASIAAWAEAHPTPGLLPPLALDVHDRPWPVERADEQGQARERRQRDQEVEDIGHGSLVAPPDAGPEPS